MVEFMLNTVVSANRNSLDTALATYFGASIFGVSHDPQGVRVNFDGSPSLQQQADAENIVNSHNTIVLTADIYSITADGVDTSIISWDGSGVFDVTIYLNGEVFNSGVDSVAPFSVTLSTDIAGTYTVKVQKQGTYETGHIDIGAV